MASFDSLCQPVVCIDCKSTESSFWHKSAAGALCTTCYCQRDGLNRSTRRHGLSSTSSTSASKVADEPSLSDNSVKCGSTNVTRKSSRLKPLTKNKLWQSVAKPSSTKGRSKRYIFKKNPVKSPSSVATVVTSDYIFFNGSYWQVGDIVSVTDVDDGLKYYAQLRGFLEDQYYQKSAVITWLIPSPSSRHSQRGFDPSLYVAGPAEELPRDMAHFEFICHAPSDYFKHGTQYKSQQVDSRLLGCVWTTLGPSIETVSCTDTANVDSGGLHVAAGDDVQRYVNDNEDKTTSKTRSHKITRPKDRH